MYFLTFWNSERVSGPGSPIPNSFLALWSVYACWRENHCQYPSGRRELNPAASLHVQCPRHERFWGRADSRGTRHSCIYCPSFSEGSEPSCTTQTLLTTTSMQHKPWIQQITAVITVLFIWEAKSKIASDLWKHRGAKWWALCLDPQRLQMKSVRARYLNGCFWG